MMKASNPAPLWFIKDKCPLSGYSYITIALALEAAAWKHKNIKLSNITEQNMHYFADTMSVNISKA